jgi:hypothetical protein
MVAYGGVFAYLGGTECWPGPLVLSLSLSLSLSHAVLFDMSRSLLSAPPVGVPVVDPLPVSEQAAPRTG